LLDRFDEARAPALTGNLFAESMLKNRSVPVETVLPHITYQNVAEPDGVRRGC
jgi:hypothetical protein